MRDFGDDAEAIDGDDDFFDGVDDFSDDDGVRHDGWREDEPDTINVEQTSPLPAPASLESAGEIEDDDDHLEPNYGVVQAAAALVGFGDRVEDDDDDERESCFAESPRATQSETFDDSDDERPVPDFAYELLASIVAGLAWRKEQSILMETFIKWLEVAGDAAQSATPPASPSKFEGRPPLAPTYPTSPVNEDLSEAKRAVLTRARAVAAAEADVVQREERCAAIEAEAVERMERLVEAEQALEQREEAVKRREEAVASAAADQAMAGADLDERERQLCTAPPVKVEPNEWADAVAASAEHHLRELSLENKQLKRHQRRTAKRGRRIAAVLLWRKMHVLDARTGAQKAFAAWYVFAQNTQPSSKQKRVRAARLCLESRAGSVLDGVHAHYSASKLVKGGLRRELSLERFWALARDFHLAPAFASYAYLMHLARDVLRGDSALSREQFGRALAQLALEAAGKAGEPPSVAVARVLDCMETSNGLAKVGLARAVKFRHG